MSGGSFDYLFRAGSDLTPRLHDLHRMAEAIEEEVGGVQAALETRRVIALMKEARAIAETLSKVWQAVEWHYSGDWGKDAMVAAVTAFQAEHGTKYPDPPKFEEIAFLKIVTLSKEIAKLREDLDKVLVR